MIVSTPISSLLAASRLSAWAGKIADSLPDDTFKGIHHLAFFDWAMLVPYFGVLIVLSCYGLHRYAMIRGYMKHHKSFTGEPPGRFEALPRVTIQLPIYNERYVVERLLEETSKIDYPRDLLQIQVLDDSTDDTHPFTRSLVEDYREAGVPIEYIHRENRHGYKAGALENGLKTASGEIVAIFDADFVPPRDFLHRTVHYFVDSKVGMVQTRWGYLNRHYNVLTEVQAMLLDGHFVLEHIARAGGGLFFNFNGTAGVLRKSMIEDAGGWQHDTLTEDSDLSYRAQLKGWKFVYVPSMECPSELPVETYGFQVQQSRWAKGLTQVAMKLLPSILKVGSAVASQGRGVFPPYAQHLLPADDRGQRHDAAGDDRALLHGLVGDVVDRFSADRGVVLVDFGVLRRGASRAVPQDLEAGVSVSAGADGRGRRADHHQFARGVRGADRI